MATSEETWLKIVQELSRRPVSDRDSSYRIQLDPNGDGQTTALSENADQAINTAARQLLNALSKPDSDRTTKR